MNLLQMSFSGAILILAVIVVRAICINKLPKRTFLALWCIVLLRLLIPFSIPSMLSVYSLINHSASVREAVSDVDVTDSIQTTQTGQLFIGDGAAQIQTPQEDQGNVNVSV